MMEHAKEILVGLDLLMKAAKVDKGFIGIEENKPEAITLFQKLTEGNDRVTVVPLKQKYPQGGEKQLVNAVTGREVPPPPAIPVNVGAIVQNVGTAFAVYQAVMKHKPLLERYTTVTGKLVKEPGNFLVRIGTPFRQLIEACGGLPEGDNKVLAGGPMMGKAVVSLDVPVCKGTNSVTVLSLATLAANQRYDELEQECVTYCISCGCCQFTCPSHRPLLDNISQGKGVVMGRIKARAKKK